MASHQHGAFLGEEFGILKVLVTGASGFIGSHLVPALLAAGHDVVAPSRARRSCHPAAISCAAHELGPDTDWTPVLGGIDVVVHLAGRAHVTSDRGGSLTENLHRRINTDGTRALARQAASAGVGQFVFLSSCHAVASESDKMLTRVSEPRPSSAYGKSKLAAEHAVREEFEGADGAWTILRPPLVYGRGNRANFAKLAGAVRGSLPLPVAGIGNRRSFLGVANLCDFILRGCLGNRDSHNKIFYPADEQDFSTPVLVETMASAAGKKAHTFALPSTALRLIMRLPGSGALRTLSSSLYVDKNPAREELGWNAPHSTKTLLGDLF